MKCLHRTGIIFLTAIYWLGAPTICIADNTTPVDPWQYPEDDEDDKLLPAWLDTTQTSVSETITDVSTDIDQFLSLNEEEEPMVNESYLRIRLKPYYTHRGDFEFDSSIALRMDLPHAEKDWKLIFETDPEDYESLENKERGIADTTGTENRGAIAGVRLESRKFSEWYADFDVGLKLRLPLDPFTRARFRRVDKLGAGWTSLVRQEFFYYHSKGPGTLTSADFYNALEPAELTILRVGASAQFLDDDDNWQFVNLAEIYDRISNRNLFTYSIGLSANSRPNLSTENAWISFSWQRRLHKHWLYMKLTPSVNFQKEYDYKINPGILAEIELYFTKNRRFNQLYRSIPKP
ncbi:hypothetical protein [Photobacterium galatheae]|uniref:Uncharacterized protein n=1 Tax=Photobacterium galatheae TaxID=1654360 RepID=A0A066RN04_9GAMM|nr:hypothetical protein [Photobacterium galatheae]KDM91704.1 hypothetical protein EA58_10055 [Photobacterium galatheae]MCM0149815.1 hypothetical protein [Photobacterium galatheae]